MKHRFTAMAAFFLLFCFLCFPTQVKNGAASGLLLWYQALLPSLFPFLILSSLLLRLSLAAPINRLLSPIVRRLFGLPAFCGYPIALGLCSGMPVAAGVVRELKESHFLPNPAWEYTLALSNHISPAFLLVFVADTVLGAPSAGLPLCLLVYGSAWVSAMLFLRPRHDRTKDSIPWEAATQISTPSSQANDKATASFFDHLEASVSLAIQSITKIGAYVTLFSVLAALLLHFLTLLFSYLSFPPAAAALLTALFAGILETTTGSGLMLTSPLPFAVRFALCAAFAAFGGLSGLMQTRGMLAGSGISLGTYIKIKASAALLCVCLSLAFFAFM